MPATTVVSLPGFSLEEIVRGHLGYNSKEKKSPKKVVLKKKNQSETCHPEDIPVTVLTHEKSRRARYFLDSQKHPTKYWMIMIDVTLNGCLPHSTNKPCWWCRHTFSTPPVGCPVTYFPHKESGVEKERFEEKLLAANIISKKDLTSGKNKVTNDFFETEGYFCSFPCAKAYVLDMSPGLNIRYKESLGLLTLMFSTICEEIRKNGEVVVQTIPTAPSWKMLKEYGGHLTIQEFRATFGQLVYEPSVNYCRPYMFCSSQYIAEKKINTLFQGVKE